MFLWFSADISWKIEENQVNSSKYDLELVIFNIGAVENAGKSL